MFVISLLPHLRLYLQCNLLGKMLHLKTLDEQETITVSAQHKNKFYLTGFMDVFACLFPGVSGLREEFKLLRDLLAEYDPAARPVMNLSEVVEVRMGVALFQIRELVGYHSMTNTNTKKKRLRPSYACTRSFFELKEKS